MAEGGVTLPPDIRQTAPLLLERALSVALR